MKVQQWIMFEETIIQNAFISEYEKNEY